MLVTLYKSLIRYVWYYKSKNMIKLKFIIYLVYELVGIYDNYYSSSEGDI